MDELRAAIVRAVEVDAPTTCRSVSYRLVSMKAIEKTERESLGAMVEGMEL